MNCIQTFFHRKHTHTMSGELLLVRLPRGESTQLEFQPVGSVRGGFVEPSDIPPERLVCCARWDVNNTRHACSVDASGVLQSLHAAHNGGSIITRFQLHSNTRVFTPKPWRQFEFVPGVKNAVIFFQQDSNKLLYTTLPFGEEDKSLVYRIGNHPGGSLTCCAQSHARVRVSK